MKKILVVADSPVVKTGFSRVSEQLCSRLSRAGHSVSMLGINDPAIKHNYPFHIYPAFSVQSQEVMGFARLPLIIQAEKPDIVLLFNDIWVCERYYTHIKDLHQARKFKCFAYFPIDSEGYVNPMVRWLEQLDGVATYTQFGKRVLREAGFEGDVRIFPHGIDTKTFYPVDKQEARAKLFDVDFQNAFIVLNANRNQPRKQIDLTIKAFAKFAEGKDDVWLYLHMGKKDLGWDILPLFRREMLKHNNNPDRLILTSDNNSISSVTEAELNLIYNCADVCVNTSQGEGFSLTNAESSICGVPQIVPNYAACGELWGERRGLLTDVAEYITDKDLFLDRAIISTDHLAVQLDTLYKSTHLREELGKSVRNYFLQPTFQWKTIANDMKNWLTSST